jgi:hypothetical protein
MENNFPFNQRDTFECSICNTIVKSFEYKPDPVKPLSSGPCCSDCNYEVVIPAREKGRLLS